MAKKKVAKKTVKKPVAKKAGAKKASARKPAAKAVARKAEAYTPKPVHTWIAFKPSGAAGYTRYEVMGWGVSRGAPALRVNRTGPDNDWFGSRPHLLADLRGPEVDAVIEKVQAAVAAYPYRHSYRTWPGPNSNTFTAYVARAVPELRLDLPPTAIGKDYLPGGEPVALSPSGTGLQVSVFGLLGVMAAWEEGVEVNV